MRDEAIQRAKEDMRQEMENANKELETKINENEGQMKTEIEELIKEAKEQVKSEIETEIDTLLSQTKEQTKTEMRTEMNNAIKNVKLDIYPVGSIYISTSSTNPATLFGGTWENYGKGRTLVGIDTSQTEFNSIGKTGGEKTHYHATSNHTLTISEMPSHNHEYKYPLLAYVTSGGRFGGNWLPGGSIVSWTTDMYQVGGQLVKDVGGGQPHNHGNTAAQSSLQPYIVVYMWRRTA